MREKRLNFPMMKNGQLFQDTPHFFPLPFYYYLKEGLLLLNPPSASSKLPVRRHLIFRPKKMVNFSEPPIT